MWSEPKFPKYVNFLCTIMLIYYLLYIYTPIDLRFNGCFYNQIVSKLAWILVDFYNGNKSTIAKKFDVENFNGNNDFNL
jgi:hypothetical protein